MSMTKQDLNDLFEKYGYYMEDYILSKAYLSLYYLLNKKTVGQEVFSLCLDGPSGAGKTSFVEAYTKVASELLGEEVHFINFQLDAETGKSDLYEDVDVVATFENDTSKIRIPGTILKAIELVNKGNYVILKMDEYDKARDSTDTFFNNFLQEGIVNTIQHGDVRINPQNYGKLQVFLCKNDMRVDLSEPMMRRNRIIRLDYMTPERMFTILQKFTKDNHLDEGLLNLVTLMYQQIYKNRELYTKLPSCSECQQAIMDSYLLLQVGGFSKNDIYHNIIENMLKIEDDVKSFESSLDKKGNEDLKELITEMKTDSELVSEDKIDLNGMIARTIFKQESQKLTDKVDEMQSLIADYREKFKTMEEKRRETIEREVKKIMLENGNLVSTMKIPNVQRNFGDESFYVKRGMDIFQTSSGEWTDVAEIYFPTLAHDNFIAKLLENAKELDVRIYENGIVLRDEDDIKMIVINDCDKDGKSRYRIMSSQPVIPAPFLEDVSNLLNVMIEVEKDQPKTSGQIVDQVIGTEKYSYSYNALVYSDDDPYLEKNDSRINFDRVEENVYNVIFDGNDSVDARKNIKALTCKDLRKAKDVSEKIMSNKKKVLTNE